MKVKGKKHKIVYITMIKNVCLYKFFYTLQEQMFCHVPLKEGKRPDGSDDDSVSNLSLLCLQSSSIS